MLPKPGRCHQIIQCIGLAKTFVQLETPLRNKVLGENENCVSYFYFKPKKLFGQPNKFTANYTSVQSTDLNHTGDGKTLVL